MKDEKNDQKDKLIVVEEDISEVVKNSLKQKELSKEEVDKLLKETKESIEFLNKVKEIDLNDTIDRVIFTDGDIQLVYINGEFFEVSTIDSTKKKKKKKKQEARDMYLEYFIKYQLNPLLELQKNKTPIKTITNEINERSAKINNLKNSVEIEKKKIPTKRAPTKKKENEDITR